MGPVNLDPVPPSHEAVPLDARPTIAPYAAVWSLGSVAPIYYDVRRGHFVDIHLPSHPRHEGPVWRLDMDLIFLELQSLLADSV
jgi:hypothetical protein